MSIAHKYREIEPHLVGTWHRPVKEVPEIYVGRKLAAQELYQTISTLVLEDGHTGHK